MTDSQVFPTKSFQRPGLRPPRQPRAASTLSSLPPLPPLVLTSTGEVDRRASALKLTTGICSNYYISIYLSLPVLVYKLMMQYISTYAYITWSGMRVKSIYIYIYYITHVLYMMWTCGEYIYTYIYIYIYIYTRITKKARRS